MTNQLLGGNRPLAFRREIVEPVLRTLMAGDSCSLVGVGSSGKSNVARHLARPDVLAYHLGDAAPTRLSVLVNCTDLSDLTAGAFHTLILESLLSAVQVASHLPAQLASQIEGLFDRATETASPERKRTYLKQALALVFQSGVEQVFVILDDFDHVARHAPSATLNSLRSLRDSYKTKVAYLTLTRRELAFLRDEAEFQELFEIVSPTTIAVGASSDEDARVMARQLAEQWGLAHRLTPACVQRVLELSGNHSGLLKAILLAMRHNEQISPVAPDALEKLQTHQDVLPECERIWESLETEETDDLAAIAGQQPPAGSGVTQLLTKGLIRAGAAGDYEIASPLFAALVASRSAPSSDGSAPGRVRIEFDPMRGEVRIDGHAVRHLGAVELRLLAKICECYPQPATCAELLVEMLAVEPVPRRYGGSPDARLAQYLTELKRRLDLVKLDCLNIRNDGGCRLML